MASATAVSPTELVIRLKQPDPAFLTYLTQAAGSQESPKAWKTPTARRCRWARVPTCWTPRHGRRQLLSSPRTRITGITRTALRQDRDERLHHRHLLLDAIKGGQVNAANTPTTPPRPDQERGLHRVAAGTELEGPVLLDRNGTMTGRSARSGCARRSTTRSTKPPCSRTSVRVRTHDLAGLPEEFRGI